MRKWEIPPLLPLMATITNHRGSGVFLSFCWISSVVLGLGKRNGTKRNL